MFNDRSDYDEFVPVAHLAGLLIAVSSRLVEAQKPLPPPGTQKTHPQNIKQLTFGGQNAEAYFSHDGTRLIFQSTRPPFDCDQIFSMKVDGSDVKLLALQAFLWRIWHYHIDWVTTKRTRVP